MLRIFILSIKLIINGLALLLLRSLLNAAVASRLKYYAPLSRRYICSLSRAASRAARRCDTLDAELDGYLRAI